MTTLAIEIARERQLDWLLSELLGNEHRSQARAHPATLPGQWLAAAIALLAVAVAFAVAALREDPPVVPVQEPIPPIEWFECHGPAALDRVPDDVVNLRCYDFTDEALADLPHFHKLTRLDLSGMDVNAKGYSVSLPITDAGLRHLAGLPLLRWLSLASCHAVTGTTLNVLEAIPRLEHLDLTSTGIKSPAVERLQQLPSLRSLSLSYCLDFHGRSLAAVAKIPGLRHLELAGCATLAAKDVMHLSKLSELRHLDLRDCMGRFRGQTAMVFDEITIGQQDPPPPPPTQDGIGVTDDVVAALAALPLDTLRLRGCSALTNAIAPALRAMTQLRTLGIGELYKTTSALLALLPDQLESLSLDGNWHYQRSGFGALARFHQLRELGLTGLAQMTDNELATAVSNKHLTTLRIGGTPRMERGGGRSNTHQPKLTAAAAVTLAGLRELERLDLSHATWVDAAAFAELARLPRLQRVDLSYITIPDAAFAALANSPSLREISLLSCRSIGLDALRGLQPLPLRDLDLYRTRLQSNEVQDLAKAWPGCSIRLPDARRYTVAQ